MLKKLFYASASILMLAIAYHLGATTAAAQAPGNPIVGAAYSTSSYNGGVFAFAANGDVYLLPSGGNTWVHTLNLFTNQTPTAQPSWGQLKAQYRK
jgi:hypothetical protein